MAVLPAASLGTCQSHALPAKENIIVPTIKVRFITDRAFDRKAGQSEGWAPMIFDHGQFL